MESQFSPLISVGIPTYNGERYIAKAIYSVLAQTYSNIELIISDNCSTDGTAFIVEEFQKNDSRVKYIRQPSNIGIIQNFNILPTIANGDYFIFFADDDILDVDYIKLLWEEFLKNPEIIMSIGSIKIIELNGNEIEHVNNFAGAKVETTLNMKPVDRVSRIIRYAYTREWAWGIILGLHKKEILLKNSFNLKLIDPGTLFYMSVIYEGNIAFNKDAVFYKRLGGMSGGENYGRSKVTFKSKYKDAANQIFQLYYEVKTILNSAFSAKDKLKLLTVFFRYRFPTLAKAIVLYTASLFSFVLVKKPLQLIQNMLSKKTP